MLTQIKLYGLLAEEFGATHHATITTHSDIVRAINCNHPRFKRRILELDQQGFRYQLYGGAIANDNLIAPDNAYLVVAHRTIHLVPVVEGSGGLGKIFTGALLIGGGFLLGGFGAGLLPKALIGIGASLALNGVNQLLAPRTEPPKDQAENSIFGEGTGVSDFSVAIPLVYGHYRIKNPAILSSGSQAIRLKPNSETLTNESVYSALFAFSEGTIQGLVDGNSSIFLDNTEIIDEQGTSNFGEVTVGTTNGTAGQSIPDTIANANLTETSVNVELRSIDNPTVRTISGDYYAAWVKIQINALFDSDEDKIKTEPLTIRVEVRPDGGNYQLAYSTRYVAKTQVPFQDTYKFNLPNSANNTWDIRVTKIVPANAAEDVQADDNIRNDTFWNSVTGLSRRPDNYPNTALLGFEVDARFLGNAPSIALEIYGIKVSVPHNYNPTTRTYSGAFNGSLGAKQYSNNPIWVLYDVLTNSRYGVGLSASEIEIYSFYNASVYCDQKVSNGEGGRHPRFTFNAAIATRSDAQSLIRNIAASCNAFPVWSNGKIYLAQDRPTESVWAFTEANVVVDIDGEGVESPAFEYSQIEDGARFTAAAIAFINPDEQWEAYTEEIEDASLISSLGYKPIETQALGCTNREQARRIGRWEIFTSQHNDTLVTFRAARDFLPIEIGDVIEIFDRYEQGERLAGRVVASTTSTEIQLDQTVTLGGVDHVLALYRFDGTREERDILSATPDNIVTVSSPFTSDPVCGELFALLRTDIDPTKWRVLSINEEDEEIFQVQASKYLDTKWAYVEDGTLLPEPRTTFLNTGPRPPTDLKLTPELFFDNNGILRLTLTIEWRSPIAETLIKNYQVRYKLKSESTWDEILTSGNSYTFPAVNGDWEFEIRSISAIGFISPAATLSETVDFSADLPADVEEFALNPRSSNFAFFSWNAAVDRDVLLGGLIRIKYSSSGGGWNNSSVIAEFPGNSQQGIVTLLNGVYYAKWVDYYGNESVNAVSLLTGNLNLLDKNIVATLQENPSFAGAKTNVYATDDDYLTLSPQLKWDDLEGNWDDVEGIWDNQTGDGFETSGTYVFANSLVLSSIQDVQLIAEIDSFTTANSIPWDDATGDWDSRAGAWDGTPSNQATVKTQVRTSDDGVTFGGWQDFSVATLNFLEAEFRLRLASTDEQQNIFVIAAKVEADVADRSETGTVTTSTGGVTSVTFSQPFVVAPPFGIDYSIQSGTTEDEVNITNVTNTGFNIDILQSGGRISRVVKWSTESY